MAVAEMGSLPLPEFDRQAKAIEKKLQEVCPLAAHSLFGRLQWMRYLDADSEARMAMLKAAIAIALDGPDRAKDFKDPFGNGPFEYRPIGKGFELKSRLVYQDKPVTLKVCGGNP